jgi:hypothetical protein
MMRTDTEKFYDAMHLIQNMICEIVQKILKTDVLMKTESDYESHERNALMFSFENQERTNMGLLIWAPSNYVSVFEFDDDHSIYDEGFFERLKQISCHDSCWREDGVAKFIRKCEPRRLSTFHGFSVISLNDEQLKTLQKLRSAR